MPSSRFPISCRRCPRCFSRAAPMALLILGVFQGESAAREIAWLAVAALVVAFALVLAASGARAGAPGQPLSAFS